MLPLKPNVIEDIKPSDGAKRFTPLPRYVNLGYRRVVRIPLVRFLKVAIICGAFVILVLGSASAPTNATFAANTSNDQERQVLEAQLKELESQIDQYNTQIASYQKQGKSLKGEIGKLNDKIAKLNLQIRAINLTLVELDKKIAETQGQISETEVSIASNKQALASLVRTLYMNEQTSLVEVFLKNPKLSDFFGDLNNTVVLQNSVRVTIGQITDLHSQLQDQKDQFALAKADAQTVKAYQAEQKNQTDQLKSAKNNLLVTTQGQESKYQTLLKLTKQTAAQIRTRIFQLLGGGELTFEQAYQYAKLASDATGVRPAFILAILDRESALGQNVGRCSYLTAMSPSNQTVFLELLKRLNIPPASVNVSCANADGAYGGAMGPAQFIPSTWVGYENQIAKITGHTPPSPWNNADAFTAAALYLRDAGAATNEKMAAAKYYCGARWNRSVCTNVYAANVLNQADQFQDDIATITQ